MKKLLNTLYVNSDNTYLSLDGENVVCLLDNNEKFRLPLTNIESIVCFNYVGCSPALMGKCVDYSIPISFISPNGKFLAKISGETRGNVRLRISQIDCFREKGLLLSQNQIASKLCNTRYLIKRSIRDNESICNNENVLKVVSYLENSISSIYETQSVEQIMGIEGNCAHQYFSIFDDLILSQKDDFEFQQRNKRPPLDRTNAILSFLYTIHTSEYASALEAVGFDSCIGFCHSLRSGRRSLACDLVEETRCLVERATLSIINMKMINKNDFDYQISGAVLLSADGRKKVLKYWQDRKRTEIIHPYIGKKIQIGLIPYIQSTLLVQYVRGEIDEYPCFIQK